MVFEGRIFLLVHVARIPFVFGARYGVNPPVKEDAEFGVLVPLRHFPAPQRLPVGSVRTRSDLLVDMVQDGGARSVVFGCGTLPLAIYLGGRFCSGGGGGRAQGWFHKETTTQHKKDTREKIRDT